MGKVEVKKQKKKDALFNTAFELFYHQRHQPDDHL